MKINWKLYVGVFIGTIILCFLVNTPPELAPFLAIAAVYGVYELQRSETPEAKERAARKKAREAEIRAQNNKIYEEERIRAQARADVRARANEDEYYAERRRKRKLPTPF